MILLLGGSGYVGAAYRRHLEAEGIPFCNIQRSDSDYTQLPTLIALLRRHRPEFVINCAGYTGKPNVDACELHKAECLQGNAVLPGLIRQACEETRTPWGHVSSGCIFTGQKSEAESDETPLSFAAISDQPSAIPTPNSQLPSTIAGFTEDDAPNFTFRQNNCSFYSGTKALGEEVLQGAQNCYIWRLRIPFNNIDHPRNYLSKVMRYERLLEARNSLSQLDEFVRAAVECWEQRAPFGTYNVTNPGSVTTHEVVKLIRKSGLVNKAFKFFKDEEDFMRQAAKTPRSNCVLDTTKLRQAGIQMTEVHEAIELALRNWKQA